MMTWSIYFIFLTLDILGGFEVFPPLSHWATVTSVFHTVVRHCSFTAVGCVCYSGYSVTVVSKWCNGSRIS